MLLFDSFHLMHYLVDRTKYLLHLPLLHFAHLLTLSLLLLDGVFVFVEVGVDIVFDWHVSPYLINISALTQLLILLLLHIFNLLFDLFIKSCPNGVYEAACEHFVVGVEVYPRRLPNAISTGIGHCFVNKLGFLIE